VWASHAIEQPHQRLATGVGAAVPRKGVVGDERFPVAGSSFSVCLCACVCACVCVCVCVCVCARARVVSGVYVSRVGAGVR